MQDPVVGRDSAADTDTPTDTGGVTDSSVGGVPTSGQDTPAGAAQADGATDGADAPEVTAVEDEAAGTAEGSGPVDPELERLRTELAGRTADLQRVSAEFANYRRRIERERDATVAGAKASVANELLTVLDDVERAQSHGDLTGPFKVVADRLTETLHRSGLEAFGAEGDVFDPSVHEAVAHETSPEVTGPTVTTVMRRGYRFGDRVLRPAMVAVTDTDGTAGPVPGVAAAETEAEAAEAAEAAESSEPSEPSEPSASAEAGRA